MDCFFWSYTKGTKCGRTFTQLKNAGLICYQTEQPTVNAYERDSRARQRCLEVFGFDCSVCGMNFKKAYGTIGESYIYVHHLSPLANRGEKYEVDPEKDLRPVCPNCHAMLHRKDPPFSIEELQGILEQNRSSK